MVLIWVYTPHPCTTKCWIETERNRLLEEPYWIRMAREIIFLVGRKLLEGFGKLKFSQQGDVQVR